MSKNLTRKGLALGALFALASSVIAGAPAQASSAVTVAPALGTSLVTTVGTKFVVSANVGSAVTDTAAGTLKFSISNAGKNLSTFRAVDTTVALANTAALAGTIVADTTNTTIVTAAAAGMTSAKTAAVAISTSATASTTADVTAFLDLNGNNAVDAGENTGNSITIRFAAAGDLTAAGTLTAPVLSSSAGTLAGKFTTTPALNANYATNVALSYTAPATVFASGTSLDSTSNAQGTDGSWTGTVATTKIIAGDYTAQVKVGSTLVGTAVKQTVAAVSVATFTNTLTASADAKGISANVGSIRATAKAATFVSTLKSAATGTPAVAAGIPVVATVRQTVGTSTSSVLDSKITVGGKTLVTLATDVTIDLVTDANGQVSLPITSTTGTLNDALTITLSSEGVTAAAYTVTFVAPTYTVVDSKDDAGSATNRATTRGGSVVFDMVVNDQFAQPITGGARLKVAVTGGFTATTYPVIAAGKVSVTIKDTQTTTSTANNVAVTLQTQNSADLNWSDNAATAAYIINISSAALDFDVKVNGGAWTSSTVQGKITGTVTPDAYTAAAPANGVALKNNTWTTVNVVAAPSTTQVGQEVTVSGAGLLFKVGTKFYPDTVTTFSGTNGDFDVDVFSQKSGDQTVTFATGAASYTAVVTFAAGAPAAVAFGGDLKVIPGQTANVTISITDKWGNPVNAAATGTTNAGALTVTMEGVGFQAGSAPISTSTVGRYVAKWSFGMEDVGKATITATLDLSTDVVATQEITSAKPVVEPPTPPVVIDPKAALNGAVKVTIVAAAQAQVGQALDVVITTTDVTGKAVSTPVELSSTGVGYLANRGLVVTDSNGKYTVKLIVGSADAGTAFINAKLYTAAGVQSAGASTEIGLADVDVVSGGKRIFVNSEFAKGRTLTVTINGKRIYSKVQTTDNAVELAFTQRRAGTYTVTVRLSGGIVFTEKVTIN